MVFYQKILLALSLLLSACPGCTFVRTVWFFKPDTSDYRHFPHRLIENGGQVFQFRQPAQPENLGQRVRISDRFVQNFVCLDDFVKRYRTEAFLIIRNDTMLFENYPGGRSAADPVTTFSLSKAILTTLVGVAVQDGYVRDVRQPVTDFVPEFSHLPGVTLLDLMQHVSGIEFNHKTVSLRNDQARFYYSKNLRKLLKNRDLDSPPGTVFDYHSANTQLLALALERATGRGISQYLQEKIWQPLGMAAPAAWSLDRLPQTAGNSGKAATERAFCCLQARAVDFAKIGRLWLQNGEWDGRQIFPKDWLSSIFEMPCPLAGNYRCGFSVQADGSFFASGLYGQFILVHPEKRLLLVRFGEHRRGYTVNFWRDVLGQVAGQF